MCRVAVCGQEMQGQGTCLRGEAPVPYIAVERFHAAVRQACACLIDTDLMPMSAPNHGPHIGVCRVLALLLAIEGGATGVRGDEFKLVGGGSLEGHWLNRDDSPNALYEMRTTHGVRVVLDKTSIIQAAPGTSAEEQYRAIVACQGEDVAGQWAVAEWCRTHALEPLRRQHLRRVLDLEPDHAGARQALGYTQVRGRWVTQAEFMQQQGYVLYRGKWQLSQEVERAEAERRTALAERQWYRQLLRWRHEWLTQRSEDVTAQVLEVRDPQAVPGLAIMMHREELRPLKILWIRTLARIRTPEACDLLADVVLQDTDLEVIHECLDCLVEIDSPHIRRTFLEALKHENNDCVNRAGLALGRLGGKTAIDALIDALVTHHVLHTRAREMVKPIR